jgi:CBS domain containing-hemolysin-like protein
MGPALLVIFLLLCNAFFVAAEFAMVAIRGTHIEQLRAAGKPRTAKILAGLKEQTASAVGALQVGITVSNLLLGSLGEPVISGALEHMLGPVFESLGHVGPIIATSLGFLFVTYLTVVFSEQLPKVLAIRHVAIVASLTARPIKLLLTVTWPLVWIMNKSSNLVTRPLGLGSVEDAEGEIHTVDDLRTITSEAAAHGTLSGRERSLILNTLALGRRTARQIMVPRVKVAYLDLKKSMEDNRRVMNEHLYSRLPLVDGSIDHVIGIVSTREFLAAFHAEGDTSVLQLLARPAVFAPATISLDKMLVLVDEKRTQMVMLVDEHGGTEGIVTLRDIVDELVGQPISRPAASLPGDAQPQTVFAGDTPVHEASAKLGIDIATDGSVVTIGGLVTEHLGRFPRIGDEVEISGLTFRVVDGDNRVVRRVEVRPTEVVTSE